jgi:hypothetical protein
LVGWEFNIVIFLDLPSHNPCHGFWRLKWVSSSLSRSFFIFLILSLNIGLLGYWHSLFSFLLSFLWSWPRLTQMFFIVALKKNLGFFFIYLSIWCWFKNWDL